MRIALSDLEPIAEGRISLDDIEPLDGPQQNQSSGDSPSMLGEVGKSLVRGVGDLTSMAGEAAQFFDEPGGSDTIRNAGQSLIDTGEGIKSQFPEDPSLQQARQDSPFDFKAGVSQAAQMLAPSVGPTLAGAAVGSVIPVVGTAAGALAGMLSSMPIFYGSQANQTYKQVHDELIKQGKDEKTAHDTARIAAHKSGGVEAGFEMVSDFIPLKFLKLVPSRIRGQLIKQATKPVRSVSEMVNGLAQVIAGETATEITQVIAEDYIAKDATGGKVDFEQAKQVVVPTIIMSLATFGMFEGVGSLRRNNIRKALEDPKVDKKQRIDAVNSVAKELNATDPELASMWLKSAMPSLREGKPVVVSDDKTYSIKAEAERRAKEAPVPEPPQIVSQDDLEEIDAPLFNPDAGLTDYGAEGETTPVDLYLDDQQQQRDFPAEDDNIVDPELIQELQKAEQKRTMEQDTRLQREFQSAQKGIAQDEKDIAQAEKDAEQQAMMDEINTPPRGTAMADAFAAAMDKKAPVTAPPQSDTVAQKDRPLTPKQKHQKAKLVDPSKDTLLEAVAKLGGYNREDAEGQGSDPADFGKRGWRFHHVFTNKGMTADGLAIALADEGWTQFIDSGTTGNADINKFLDAFDKAIRGENPGYSTWRSTSDEQFTKEAEYRAYQDDEVAKLAPDYVPDPEENATLAGIDDVQFTGETENTINEAYSDDQSSQESYEQDWDAATKTLSDIYDDAAAIDENAAMAIMEHSPTEAQIVASLLKIIEGNKDDKRNGGQSVGQEEAGQGNGVQAETPDTVQKPVSTDLLGDDTSKAQALKDEKRKKDEARNGVKDVPATGHGDLFDPDARKQVDIMDVIDAKANEAATSPTNATPLPTPEQIESGNYKKGHVAIHGLDISIENPVGSKREGTDSDGKKWSVTMKSAYGYIRGTVGRDKDHVDVFLGSETGNEAPRIFVVDQVDPATGRFDEHKVMFGFKTKPGAASAYRANYAKGWKGLGNITEMSLDEFKTWVFDKNATKKAAAKVDNKTGKVDKDSVKVDKDGAEKRAVKPNEPTSVKTEPASAKASPSTVKRTTGYLRGMISVAKKLGKDSEIKSLTRELKDLLTKEADQGVAKFSRATTAKPGTSVESIQSAIQPALDALNTDVPVHVVATAEELPEDLRKEMAERGVTAIEGVAHNGEIYLVADQIKSVERAKVVLLDHELRHLGLRKMFGRRLTTLLGQVFHGDMNAEVVAFAKEKGIDITTRNGRYEAAEEFIVNMAETGQTNSTLEKLYAIIRDWLRKAGLNIELTNVDLREIVAQAGTRETLAVDGGMSFYPAFGRVFHGSPHSFDSFDSSKIGTGEGAQAYGHGIYLAENPGVAKSYQTLNPSASVPPRRTFKGEELTPGSPEYHAATLVETSTGRIASIKKEVQGWIDEWVAKGRPMDGQEVTGWRKTLNILDQSGSKKDFGTLKHQGNLLTVDIPDEQIAKMLDWDAPLSEQPVSVKNALKRLGIGGSQPRPISYNELITNGATPREAEQFAREFKRMAEQDPTGMQILRKELAGVTDSNGVVKRPEDLLKGAGIPGIKYFDGGSRSSGKGTRNYVVFDDKSLTILEKNGKKVSFNDAIAGQKETLATSAVDGQTRFSIAGKNAKTADMKALAQARTLEKGGATREKIWAETGWFRGVDNLWKYEINDIGTKIQRKAQFYTPISEISSFPELYDAYPSLKKILGNFSHGGKEGSYSPKSIKVTGIGENERRSVMLHELQHAIQDIEGFATGGSALMEWGKFDSASSDAVLEVNDWIIKQGWADRVGLIDPSMSEDPENELAHMAVEVGQIEGVSNEDLLHMDDIVFSAVKAIEEGFLSPFDQYHKMAGEVEARAVEARKDMTAEERRARPPWLDYDIAGSEQIVNTVPAKVAQAVDELAARRGAKKDAKRQMVFDAFINSDRSDGAPVVDGVSVGVPEYGPEWQAYIGLANGFSPAALVREKTAEIETERKAGRLTDQEYAGEQAELKTFIRTLNDAKGKRVEITYDGDTRFSRVMTGVGPAQTEGVVRDDVNDIQEQAILDKVNPDVAKETLAERSIGWRTNLGVRINQGMADQYGSIRDLLKDEHSWKLARMSHASSGATEAVFLHGKIVMDEEGGISIAEGSQGLAGVLGGLKGEHDYFMAWIAANRSRRIKDAAVKAQVKADALGASAKAATKEARRLSSHAVSSKEDVSQISELKKQARKLRKESKAWAKKAQITERLFTEEEITQLQALNRGTMADGRNRAEAYQEALDKFNELQNSVLDIAENSGLINAEERESWDSEFYVPFYRMFEGNSQGPATIGGLANQTAFKQLRGSERALNDLLANTVMNWSHLLSASMKNRAAVGAINSAVEMGIATDVTKQAKKHMAATGKPLKDAIFVRVDGKPVWYTVSEPLVMQALESMHYSALKSPGAREVMQVMSWFKRAFTFGVTQNPAFWVRNLMRDTIHSMAVSDISASTLGLGNIVQGLSGVTDSALRNQLMASGGEIHFGHLYSGDPGAARSAFMRKVSRTDVLHDKGAQSRLWGVVKKAGYGWMEIGSAAENVNRSALYQQLRKQGVSHFEASFQSRDLLDFSQQGAWTAMRFLAGVTPFLNARIQGLERGGRGAVHNPAKFAAITGMVAAASILLYLHYHDDDDFKERPEWDRDTYWWFKAGGYEFRIPKPFEVGVIGTIAERAVEQYVDKEKPSKLFVERLIHSLTETFQMNPSPASWQAVRPTAEVWANYDAFRKRPIESMGMEGLSKPLRKRSRTSPAAQAISEGMYSVAKAAADTGIIEKPNDATLSPVQIEHLVKGYFGWIGVVGMNIMDAPFNLGLPDKPSMRLEDMPVVGGFVRNSKDERRYTRYGTEFYKAVTRARELNRDINALKKHGRTDDAKRLATENKQLLRRRKSMNRDAKRISNYNRQISNITLDKNMSGPDKEKRINTLLVRKNMVFKRVVEARR